MYQKLNNVMKMIARRVINYGLFSVLFVILSSPSAQAQRPGAGLPVPVKVDRVLEQEIPDGRTFVGTVKPLRSSVVGTAVDGRVVEFLHDPKDPLTKIIRVEQGEPLAQLRTGTIELELAAAKADLQLRQQELNELENGARPEELEQAKARLLGAQALRDYSNSKSRRARELFRQGKAISREELDLSESNRVQSEQGYLEAKAAYELAQKGPRQEKKDQAKARLQYQQEEVKRIQDMLNKYTIRSPFSGYVVAEHTEVGHWVSKGDSVAEVIDLNTVEVEINVSERVIVRLSLGMNVSLSINALPKRKFQGVISRMIFQADVLSRTFPVKVRLSNPKSNDGTHLLKSGMLAQVTVAAGDPRPATLVHKDALVLNGAQTQVVVVDLSPGDSNQGKVRVVPVQKGIPSGNLIQVTGALKKGEYVVVLGNERLRPQQSVQVINQPEQ